MVGTTGALFPIGMVISVIEARRVDPRPLDRPTHLWVTSFGAGLLHGCISGTPHCVGPG